MDELGPKVKASIFQHLFVSSKISSIFKYDFLLISGMTTFVFVPGAWLGSWVWKKIVPDLRERGHEVFLVTLTGMGERVHLANPEFDVDTAVNDVINAIEYEDLHNVVLVGHSFAGKIVAKVQDRIPERIGRIIFLDAIRPDKIRTPQGGKENWSEKDIIEIREECNKKGDGWKFPLTDEILQNIGYDITGEDKEWFLSKVTPWPINLIFGSIELTENYDKAKKAYIFCTGGGDDVNEILKEPLDGPYRVIESGHWPMITKPDDLIRDLLELSLDKMQT